MRVVRRKRLREFWRVHPGAEEPLRRWYRIALASRWKNLADVRRVFPHADAVKVRSGTTMTVFNIAGNRYRIVARVIYAYGRIYVRTVLTHAAYSRGRWKENL